MRTRSTAGAALVAAAGLVITSLVAVAAPAHAAAPTISATPNVVVDGDTITLKGNAGRAGAPPLYVAFCEGAATATNCVMNTTGVGTPDAYILQVTPNAKTGAWGPVQLKARKILKTGNTPAGYNCLTNNTCLVGSSNSANPKDHTYNATARVTFANSHITAVAKPKVTGKAKVGKKLKATKGTWSPAATSYKYQWLRNGKAIKKATHVKYKLTKKDKGKKVSVSVTAAAPSYAPTTVKSKAKKIK